MVAQSRIVRLPITVAVVVGVLAVAVLHATSASDTFTYGNGNLITVSSSAWTQVTSSTDLVVTTGQVHAAPIAEFQSVMYSTGTWANDGESQITMVSGQNGWAGPCVRMTTGSGGNGYCFLVWESNNAATGIYEFNAGADTALEVGYTAPAAGSVLKLTVSGTTLTAYDDGVAIGDVADATFASGKPGFMGRDNSGTDLIVFDNWSAADAGGGAAPTCLRSLLGVGCDVAPWLHVAGVR